MNQRRSYYPQRSNGPIGCIVVAWLIGLIVTFAFWGLVGWGIVELILFLRSQ